MTETQARPVHGNGTAVDDSHSKANQPSELEIALPAMDALGEELTRLAAINAELVGRLRGAAAAAHEAVTDDADGESAALRQENAELRARIEALESTFAAGADDDVWAERQREYEALLEEKSEVIRSLHLKVQELQEGKRRAPNEPVPREEELVQLKQELEDQRRQLQEDEESLMAQMRQMELALSKDRAELARQRQDVQRLQADLNREIEQANSAPGLRERLNSLRRPSDAAKKEAAAASAAQDAANDSRQSSGLFRRLFG
jgi:DNA repair exonuclease SbcCD ATPase subunit